MLMLISPAKTLDYETTPTTDSFSVPDYLGQSAELIKVVKHKSEQDLMKLMHVSQKIAELNANRFRQWRLPFTADNAKQAILAFKGDVYNGLEASGLSEKQMTYAQSHLRIISGLYGLLRPLDLMQPYRLEMGLQLKTQKGDSLYQFWGELITDGVNSLLAKQDDPVLINLASKEYFKAVQQDNLDGRLITPVFKDWKNGKYKIISFFAKKARGMMVRYAIDHNVREPEELQNFDYAGYNFSSELSQSDTWVFCRD
ncbi:MAG: peroxide stress protein YaaA [SAR324 cluster bacterium]|nr:peroxide stress protein YaaA [SAR324 cluster bacterium]MBL7034170.1 peroxide stress protein YaaA [SAR324 cluster bacterium]